MILLLRAFAAGAVALTGTEAIATGVPAFKPPEAKNAAATLGVMAVLLGVLFIGITFLAVNLAIKPPGFPRDADRHLAGRAQRLRRRASPSTCSRSSRRPLLFLAANTSFNAVPAAAGDPRRRRPHARASSRFAATVWRSPTGWSCSVALAALLIVIFKGETHLLIPLYAVGVFIDFTISQTGMVRHWLRERSPG